MRVLKQLQITPDDVLPVRYALQGHPEPPRLWEKLFHSILDYLGFHSTTHETCLCKEEINSELMYILR